MRLQSLQVPRCALEVEESEFECDDGGAADVESLDEVPERAMIVLLLKHVHLQNEVAAVGDH